MNIIAKLAVVCTLFVTFTLSAGTSYAATSTRTVTEAQINQSYAVTNPVRRSITERTVDLQPGQVVVTSTLTRRSGVPVAATVTLVPSVADGRVVWSVTAVTVGGQPVSDALFAQIQARVETSWSRFVKEQLGTGVVTAVAVSDTEIIYTYETGD
jgi:hypothetical protein